MPVQASNPPSLPDSFPSFMSVFGGISAEEDTTIKPLKVPTTSRRPLPFQHRESVSSMTSASTDSSPTTTISTFDSNSGVDTSPSSSPESPSSMPLSYSKFMPPARNIESQSLSAQHGLAKLTDTPNPMRPESPNRRARNLKNLSLRMPPPSQSRPPIATAPIGTSQHMSAPPSPVVPPKSSRRKPANLTIKTPSFGSFSNSITEVVPPTPTLRHTESSPSLNSVFSPSFGPKGGMQLPRPVTHHGARRSSAAESSLSPIQTAGENGGVLHELAEEDDHLDSRESSRPKDRGYPNGPIQIYDSGVFLYLEPTAEEASKFDVVVNVAKEVANPFTNKDTKNETVVSAWRKRLSSEPQTALSDASFKSALEYPGEQTPTMAPEPEYIHVGWDHNSEILDDLFPLCELIDARINQGKKVLVHCQLGASRSASLVIAYGLYKNRHLDFNSMYEVVKDRSQWVGPNMSLIYQLTDFRSRLLRGNASKPARQEWFVQGPRRSSEPQFPRTERLERLAPSDVDGSEGQLSSNPFSQASMSSLSVPSTNATTPNSMEGFGFKSLSHKRSLSPRPLPLRQSSYHTISPSPKALAPRSSLRSLREGPYSLAKTDVFVRDALEETPALFSPRTTGFLAAPFSPPAGLPTGFQFGTRVTDPRSPPQGHERLIMPNIDEFL